MARYTYAGRAFEACGEACADGFRADREHGLIYGPYRIREEDGTVRWARDAEEFSRETLTCPYCMNDVEED